MEVKNKFCFSLLCEMFDLFDHSKQLISSDDTDVVVVARYSCVPAI